MYWMPSVLLSWYLSLNLNFAISASKFWNDLSLSYAQFLINIIVIAFLASIHVAENIFKPIKTVS